MTAVTTPGRGRSSPSSEQHRGPEFADLITVAGVPQITIHGLRHTSASLVQEHQPPVQRACRVVRLSRTAYYQPPVPASWRDAAVIAALTDAVTRYPRWGFWKLFDRLRVEGRPWNHKRVDRVYCA
jgi:hypothetical protein